MRLGFSTDFINAFNPVQYDAPRAFDPASNHFGKVIQQWNTPRYIQFKARPAEAAVE